MARKSVSGAVRLRKKLRRFEPELRRELQVALSDGGRLLAAEISDRAPTRTGRLENAVLSKDDKDGLSTRVGYSARASGFKTAWKRGGFEATFQEFGTRHHAAQPFIRPAYRAVLGRILDRIDSGRKTAIARILKSTESDSG